MRTECFPHLLTTTTEQAIVLHDLRQGCSRGGLEDGCKRLRQFLVSRDIRSLAIFADNGIDWILTDFAAQQADICVLPLPGFFSAPQLRHAFAQVAPDAILTDDPERLCELIGARLSPQESVPGTALTLLHTKPPKPVGSLPEGTGKITFSSGSTGQPKGVCLSHLQLQRQARVLANVVGITAPRHLCLLPLSTLLENLAGVYAPLLAGGEVIVPSLDSLGYRGSALAEPRRLLSVISNVQPNTLILIPQLLLLLVTAVKSGWKAPDSLRFVAVGGAKVSPHLLQEAQQAGIPVFEGYGLSECASVVSLNRPGAHRPGSCGKPLPHVQVSIEDGEILVRGATMLGYLHGNGEAGPQVLRTGDMGFLDGDGFLHVTGRKKDLLISSYGRNISPAWVESELLSGPLLTEAIVFGDARPFCVALLKARTQEVRATEIQDWIDTVNATLPDYARIRRWLRMDAGLDRNISIHATNGKLSRQLVESAFQHRIAALYEDDASSITSCPHSC